MAEPKRFYWIKLKDDFFDLETIDWLMSQKNGCEYIVLYQKLCLMSANRDGRLFATVGEMIVPYDVNKIARDTKFSIDTVVVAMELFKKIGLIYEQNDGILRIPYVEELIGSETSSAKRVREYRKKKALQCNTDVTQEIRDKRLEIRDKDIEKEIYKEKEKESDKPTTPVRHKYGKYKNVLLSDEELDELKAEFPDDWSEWIEKLGSYIASKGTKYKSHLATIRNWHRRDQEKEQKAKRSKFNNYEDDNTVDYGALEEMLLDNMMEGYDEGN